MKDLEVNDLLGLKEDDLIALPIEEWKGNVYVRIMSAEERSAIEDIFAKISESKSGSGKFRKEVLKRTVCNSKGEPLLADDAVLNNVFAKKGQSLILETIFEKACEINAFRQKDVDTLKKK